MTRLKDIERKIVASKNNPPTFSKVKKILIGVIFISIFVILSGLFFIFTYVSKSKNIEMEIIFPEEITRGKPADLDVSILNVSDIDFQNVSLFIKLSPGLLLWGKESQEDSLSSLVERIGNVSKSNIIKKHYKIIPVGDINSSQEIEISLVYFNYNGSRFEVNKKIKSSITSSAFSLDVDVPPKVVRGSLFSFKVSYVNNSQYDFSNVFLKAEFPDYFQFNKAPVPYSPLDKKFTLGPSLAQSKNEIEVSGLFAGDDKSFDINFKLFLFINNKEYLVDEKAVKINLENSPIPISILVNGNPDYIAKPDDHLTYEIAIKNLSSSALKDVTVKAKLDGFINEKTVKTDGHYDVVSKTVVWQSSDHSSLSLVEPSAELNFKIEVDISSKVPSSIKSIVNKNLFVRLEVALSSPSISGLNKEALVKTMKETKVGSLVFFNSVGYRKDPLKHIENYGPFPFKVNTPSSYTIHWYITNFGNDLSNSEVRAILPAGVKFVEGKAGSNITTAPYYDEASNSVIWEVGDVYSGSGILTGPIDGYFQLEITPVEKDVGGIIPLLGPSIFKAKDVFTRKDINIVKDVIYSSDLFGVNAAESRVTN